MLRHHSLIPLSHEHQRALALCVRIDRASPIPEADLAAWQQEITQLFQLEIKIHFAAEETVLFPAARQFAELIPLVEELSTDHALLRKCFSKANAQSLSAADLVTFGQQLSTHIRKEERQLFERMQQLMNSDDLAVLGAQLETALKDATSVCGRPAQATKLRARH
jgi:hemerythrin-like domain-containing protein